MKKQDKVLTIDRALNILHNAKKIMGGDKALILSLSASGIMDCNINDMVIQYDKDNTYVEVQAYHEEIVNRVGN